MVHEYLHTLGFKDEYVYAHGVADLYCHAHHSGANVVAIMPRSSYATDSTARSIHARQIPWMSYIVPSTLITSGSQLGTPDRFHEVTGLFKSDKCKNASKPISLWKPGHGPNIMTDVDEEIGPALEPIVRRLLIAQGAQIKRITRRITTRWLGLIKECLTIERTPDGKSVSRITPHARCLEGASPEAISDGDRDTTPTTPPPEPSPSSAPHVHQE